MNYKIVFGIILIFLLNIVFATHCIYIESASFNSPSVSWNTNVVNLPQSTTIDDANVTKIILPGAKLTATGFGTYIARCNNGAGVTQKAYSVLKMDGSRVRTNVVNNGPARQAWDFPYCVSTPNGWIDGSTYPGCGNLDTIEYDFGTGENYASQIGPHNYKLYTDNTPTKDSYGVALREKRTETFFVGGVPSVLVFGPTNKTLSFFEKDGYYESDIVFTIFKDGFISVDINDYNIECVGEGVTCTIEDTQKGIRLNTEDSKAIVFGTLRVNKNNIPKNIIIKLNIDYSVANIPTTSQYGGIKSTYSKPALINIGYLDQQDFQVQVVSEIDSIKCISADGLIGQTGPDVSPRVNLTFGGNPENNQNTISINECDTSNENWVYCSQSEFIVTIAKKIAEIAQLKDTFNVDMNTEQKQAIENEIAELSNFEISVRSLAIDNTSLNESITYISEKMGFSTDIGLNYSGAGSFGTGSTIINSLRSMFTGNDNIKFTSQNGNIISQKIPAGIYTGKISFEGNPSNYYLFNDAVFNDEIKITVDLSNGIKPFYNWFFYNEGVEEIFDSETNEIQSIEQTNVLKRGVLFSFNQNTDNTAKLFAQHAYPFFIKIEELNSMITNEYFIDTINPTPILGNEEVFTYWTGFATNKSEGCEDISLANTSGILPYNLPDTLIDFDPTQSKQKISIEEYASIKIDGVEYLQTVLYLPYDSGNNNIIQLKIDGNFLLYSKDTSCQSRPCNLTIIPAQNTLKIDNISELFNGIDNGLVCVSEENTGDNTIWTLFWNEEEILKTLDDQKELIIIDPVKICD